MLRSAISPIVLIIAGLLCLGGIAQAQTPSTLVDDTPAAIIYINSQTDPLVRLDASHDRTIAATTTPLCPYDVYLDGQWECHRVASDGKVYFGTSSHGPRNSGRFMQYDTTTGQVHPLGIINTITGEDPNVWRPQGKLHSDLIENDGYMYFGTFYGYEGKTYPGGHVIRYKLGSYELGAPFFKDMGIPYSGGLIYAAFTVDTINNRAYVNSSGNIYSYDTTLPDSTTFTPTLRGSLGGTWSNCYYHFTDSEGNLWTTAQGSNGSVYKVPLSGSMVPYSNVFPSVRRPDNLNVDAGYQWSRYFGWGDRYGSDAFLFTMSNDPFLWKFDAVEARAGRFGIGQAFKKIARIGLGGADMCVAGNTVFWLRSARVWNSYASFYGPDNPDTSFRYYTSESKAKDHHLMSINLADPRLSAPGFDPNVLDPNLVTDWGRVVDQDGRTPYRCEGMSSDGQRVYMTGDWRNLPTDPNNWHTMRAIYLNADGGYQQIWRGQFFAAVNLTSNQAPVVDAGPDQGITLPAVATLSGTVSDDGEPDPPAAVTVAWSKVSGPGTVAFANANAAATTATFSGPGTYVLRLTANDSALSSANEATFTVAGNGAPTVSISCLTSITAPTKTVSLTGMVSDDGLPVPPSVTCAWTKVSGPGPVYFADANAAITTAAFRNAGTYVLRLTASDGQASGYGQATITLDGDLRADFSGDGRVDGMDFLIWQSGYPNLVGGATHDGGDANGDGKVDGLDFLVWQSCFGVWQ